MNSNNFLAHSHSHYRHAHTICVQSVKYTTITPRISIHQTPRLLMHTHKHTLSSHLLLDVMAHTDAHTYGLWSHTHVKKHINTFTDVRIKDTQGVPSSLLRRRCPVCAIVIISAAWYCTCDFIEQDKSIFSLRRNHTHGERQSFTADILRWLLMERPVPR